MKSFHLNLNDYIVSQHMTGPQGATGPGATGPVNYGGGGAGGMANISGGAGGYVHVQWPAGATGPAGAVEAEAQKDYALTQPDLPRIGHVSATEWASAHRQKRLQWINAISFDNDLQFECAAMGMDETFRKYDSADLTDMYLRHIQAGALSPAGVVPGSFVVPQGVTHLNVSLVGGGGGGGRGGGGAGGGGSDEYVDDLRVMLREDRDEKRKRSWLDRLLDWWSK